MQQAANAGGHADWQKTAARRTYTFKSGTRKRMAGFKVGTLGCGDGMQEAVKLPKGENENEWLAVHVVDFMNEVSLLYGIISEYDTAEKYPVMKAGEYTYAWADKTTKKPIKVSAPEYVRRLFNWIEEQLNDERLFPVDIEKPFPRDFRVRVAHIFSRLFRVYAHIYCSHIEHIEEQNAEKHVNSSLKHFVLFSMEFGLLKPEEMNPVKPILMKLIGERTMRRFQQKKGGRRKTPQPSGQDQPPAQPRKQSAPRTPQPAPETAPLNDPVSGIDHESGLLPPSTNARDQEKDGCCCVIS